jgi:hypothetical protein
MFSIKLTRGVSSESESEALSIRFDRLSALLYVNFVHLVFICGVRFHET